MLRKLALTVAAWMMVILGFAQVYTDSLTQEFWPLMLPAKMVHYGEVVRDSSFVQSIEIHNRGEHTLAFMPDSVHLPDYLSVLPQDYQIQPDSSVLFQIALHPGPDALLGYRIEAIQLPFYDSTQVHGVKVSLVATVVAAKEQKEALPRVSVDRTLADFGAVYQGDTVQAIFEVVNSGQGTLELRQIETTCGCVWGQAPLKNIAPGQSASVTIFFNTSDRLYKQYKQVNIFTNDPDKQVVSVLLRGKVLAR